jgi:Penicillin-insensitive murein endopeptidase
MLLIAVAAAVTATLVVAALTATLVVAALTATPVATALTATPVATALSRWAAAVPHPGALPPPGSGLSPPVGERSRPEGAAPAAVHRGATERGRPPEAVIVWRRSRALGRPDRGRLVGGVELPAAGTHFVTVDPVTGTSPNRAWRRHGTDRLVEVLLRVAEEHAAAHPDAPRLVVGDLSRPRGGRFGKEYGGDGHRSHQNGLDADVFYPRRDGRERIPTRVAQVDRRLAQELVDRFVRAGAQYVFVGPGTGLRGPSKVVMTLGNHDDHLHVRIRPAAAGR